MTDSLGAERRAFRRLPERNLTSPDNLLNFTLDDDVITNGYRPFADGLCLARSIVHGTAMVPRVQPKTVLAPR
jgi:hypothetical protein